MTKEEALTIAEYVCRVKNMKDLNRVITNLFAYNSIPIKFKSLDELPKAIQQYECNHKSTVKTNNHKTCVSCGKKLNKED